MHSAIIRHIILSILIGIIFIACREEKKSTIDIFTLKSLRETDSTLARIYNLKKEEAFWSNRLRLAKDESIDLIIDMYSQEIVLEVKGVPLRHARYTESRGDIRHVAKNLITWSGSRFVLISGQASVPKEPIHVRSLPEQTSKLEEGYDFDFVDDVPSVFVRLICDKDLEVEFLEAGKSIPDSLLKLKRERNWLQFVLDRPDIIAIYRALPENANMILRLDRIKY